MTPQIMCIGDSHGAPGDSLERYSIAGEIALARKPDIIWDAGDWDDMESLMQFDKADRPKEYHARSLAKEIEFANRSREAFNKPIDAYNTMRRRNGKKQYRPKKISTLGNHENRINKAINVDPSHFEGLISVDNLGAKEFGWTLLPYGKAFIQDDVAFQHCYHYGPMNSIISGMYKAANLVKKKHYSCIQGHSHFLDWHTETTASGAKIHGLHVGCYFDKFMRYAGSTNREWWRGLVFLHNVKKGDFDLEAMGFERIMKGDW